MHKHILFLAITASLTACGGSSSSSSSSDNSVDTETTETETVDNDSYCQAVDSKIQLQSGDSCTLSSQQISQLGINVGGNEAQCDDGVMKIGSLTLAGNFIGGGLTLNCATNPAQEAAKVTNDKEYTGIDKPFDDYLNFNSLTVQGNAAATNEADITYAQIHSNMNGGEFSISVDPKDAVFVKEGSPARIILSFTDISISGENIVKNEATANISIVTSNLHVLGVKDYKLNCSYGGTLSQLSCNDVDIDISHLSDSLPVKANIHILGCVEDDGYTCANSISLPVQFN